MEEKTIHAEFGKLSGIRVRRCLWSIRRMRGDENNKAGDNQDKQQRPTQEQEEQDEKQQQLEEKWQKSGNKTENEP